MIIQKRKLNNLLRDFEQCLYLWMRCLIWRCSRFSVNAQLSCDTNCRILHLHKTWLNLRRRLHLITSAQQLCCDTNCRILHFRKTWLNLTRQLHLVTILGLPSASFRNSSPVFRCLLTLPLFVIRNFILRHKLSLSYGHFPSCVWIHTSLAIGT